MLHDKGLRFGIDHLPQCQSDCPTCRLSRELSLSELQVFIKLCAEFHGVDEVEVRKACEVNLQTPVSVCAIELPPAAVTKIQGSPLFTDMGSILDQPAAALADLTGFREAWIRIVLQFMRRYNLYRGPVEIRKGTREWYIPLKDLPPHELVDSSEE